VCLRHDEAVYVVQNNEVAAVLSTIAKEFKTPPAWLQGCPLDCEIWASRTYSKPAHNLATAPVLSEAA
jgi:hypothetical protein